MAFIFASFIEASAYPSNPPKGKLFFYITLTPSTNNANAGLTHLQGATLNPKHGTFSVCTLILPAFIHSFIHAATNVGMIIL